MSTLFATSPDGMRVAYDVNGTGPAIVLLHGGGRLRQDWHSAGYVDRLKNNFKVITLDLRGHGESDLSTDPKDYSPDKMGHDILAVADACDVTAFSLWGMSFGGNVGRYLAARSPRVSKLILIGTPLGSGVSGELRRYAEDFCAHWPPIVQAQRERTLDVHSLSPEDQDFIIRFKVPVALAWVRAMLDWPVIGPLDILCPTLWLVGSRDKHAIASVDEYKASLKGSNVQLHVMEGLDHEQVFTEIDRALEPMLAFMEA
jgi:pimeloyl-ACP methyl ester carboxylesterase